MSSKKLKAIYQRISCLYDNLEATDWRVLAIHEESTNELNKGAVVEVRTNSHCNEELVDLLLKEIFEVV